MNAGTRKGFCGTQGIFFCGERLAFGLPDRYVKLALKLPFDGGCLAVATERQHWQTSRVLQGHRFHIPPLPDGQAPQWPAPRRLRVLQGGHRSLKAKIQQIPACLAVEKYNSGRKYPHKKDF